MKKCLKITLISHYSEIFLHDFIQKNARELELEGAVQAVDPGTLLIFVCGVKEKVDQYLDILHQGFEGTIPDDVQVEPFLKEKNYRGIFRILE